MAKGGKRVRHSERLQMGLPGSRGARRVRPIPDAPVTNYDSRLRPFVQRIFPGLKLPHLLRTATLTCRRTVKAAAKINLNQVLSDNLWYEL